MKTGSFGRLLSPLSALAMLLAVGSTLAAPGDLYVSDVVGKQILKFTPDGTRTVFASGLDAVGPLAFDRAGNLFTTQSTQPGAILRFAPDGTQSIFASGLSLPGWPAFDGAGNLFATESFGDTGDILRFTPSGTKTTFVTGGYFAGLTFDSFGNLFVTTAGPTNLNGGIDYYSPDGTAHTFFETVNGPGPVGPDLAIEGESVYTMTSDMILASFPPMPGRSSSPLPGRLPSNLFGPFAIGLDAPLSLAFDSTGNLFVSESGSGSILKFAPDGSKSTFASGLEGSAFLAFEPVTEKLRNISARGLVGTGDDVLIGGFIVGGNALANNAVVVRAIGPSLSQAQVSNPLADPMLELHNASGEIIAANDDWQETQEEQIAATGLAPTDPNESAIYATLPTGSYTAVVRGAADTTGTALVEVYSVGQL